MTFSALEALQAFGAGRQMAQQDRQIRTRQAASTQAASGDYAGAEHTALGGGDFELATQLHSLSDADRARVLQETSVGGQLAEGLRALPLEQRLSAFQQGMPLLRGVGFHDSEIQALGTDLSDATLDSHIRTARIAQRQLRPNAGPITTRPGERVYDPGTGAIIADGGPPTPTAFQQDAAAAGIRPGTAAFTNAFTQHYSAPRIMMVDGVPTQVDGGGTGAPPPPQQNLPRANTQADIAHLAPGQQFIGPDNQVHVVPGGPTSQASGGFR